MIPLSHAWTAEDRLRVVAAMLSDLADDIAGNRYSAPGRPNYTSLQHVIFEPSAVLETLRADLEAMVKAWEVGHLPVDRDSHPSWWPQLASRLPRDERPFPVLFHDYRREPKYTGPKTVPWWFLAPHEERAQHNHGQSLQRLAERGGLSVTEMLAIVEDRRCSFDRVSKEEENATGEKIRAMIELGSH